MRFLMNVAMLLLVGLMLSPDLAEAGRRRTRSVAQVDNTPVSHAATGSLAQHKAQQLAARDQGVSASDHYALGPVTSLEGIGVGPDPASAQRACCYAGRPVKDVAVSQGASGRWYAVALYR